jgi:hypothetical protein
MQTQYQTKPHDFGVWGTAPGGKGELDHPQRKKQIMQQAVANAATNAGFIYARFAKACQAGLAWVRGSPANFVARFLFRCWHVVSALKAAQQISLGRQPSQARVAQAEGVADD